MAQNKNEYKQLVESTKLDIGFADALLEKDADLRFSPAERRSFLAEAKVLWVLAPNRNRFLKYLQQFFDEAEADGISAFKIGRYIAERLKNKQLPKLRR